MRDPDEGLDANGMITTGVRLSRIPVVYEPILEAAISAVAGSSVEGAWDARSGAVELHLYGSVASGMATPGLSDVDLLTIVCSSVTTASPCGAPMPFAAIGPSVATPAPLAASTGTSALI